MAALASDGPGRESARIQLPEIDIQSPSLVDDLRKALGRSEDRQDYACGAGFLCVRGLNDAQLLKARNAVSDMQGWFRDSSTEEKEMVRKPTPGYGPGLQYRDHMDKENYTTFAGQYSAKGREDFVVCPPLAAAKKKERNALGEPAFPVLSDPAAQLFIGDSDNRWPSSHSRLKDSMEGWYFEAEAISSKLLDACARALNLDTNSVKRMNDVLEDHTSNLVAGYHASLPSEKHQAEVGAHSDTGLLTLLIYGGGSGIDGLQLFLPSRTTKAPKSGEREWIAVSAKNWPEGAVLVNVGDSLERLSGGRFQSTPHRVLHRGPQPDRLVLAYFLAARWNATLESLVPIIENEEADGDQGKDFSKPIIAGSIHHMYHTGPLEQRRAFDEWCRKNL